jgi:homoserine dehydrogenase
VAIAIEKGYAEPDAREDLSGMDAARKGLILARLLGYRGGAPTPEDLVPRGLHDVPVEEFLERLPSFDQAWADRVEAERRKGGCCGTSCRRRRGACRRGSPP